MYRNIKNNKNSAFIPHYMYKFVWNHIKSDICEITTYFCSFTVVENVMDGYFAVNFYFYFALRSKIFSEKSVNQLVKK